MNTHVFSGTRAPKLQFDHSNALCVLSSTDKLTKIGEPQGMGGSGLDQAWAHCVTSFFPITAEEQKEQTWDSTALLKDVTKFGEAKVDSMKQQKDDELERYRKEKESEKRFEAAKKKGGKKLVVKKGGLKLKKDPEKESPLKRQF